MYIWSCGGLGDLEKAFQFEKGGCEIAVKEVDNFLGGLVVC